VSLSPVPAATRLVLVNCFASDETPAVVPDDRECQRRLVHACIERGHRRIGYLTLRDELVATPLRVAGYRDALSAAGIGYDPALVVAGDAIEDPDGIDKMSEGIDRLLSLDQQPSVICCGNDRMAMRVYGLLRSRGLDIPHDISVAGFDDYRLIAETLFPPLTTVELPYPAMGRLGAKQLMQLIDGNEAPPAGPERVRGDVAWRSSVVALSP
jgi:LacI family transcriptional regulator